MSCLRAGTTDYARPVCGGGTPGKEAVMPYRLACKDLGLAECDFVAEAKKLRKVEEMMLAHARDNHPEIIAGISFEDYKALEHRIEAAAHEVAV